MSTKRFTLLEAGGGVRSWAERAPFKFLFELPRGISPSGLKTEELTRLAKRSVSSTIAGLRF